MVDAPQEIAFDTDTDSATEISMKLAKEPAGAIAQSIPETEQEYADVHAAEKR